MKDVQTPSISREAPPPLPSGAKRREPLRWREEWKQFVVLLKRAFFSKLRNNANLLITLLAAPILALLIGFVLRHSESGHYDFASAFHIPVYLFLSLVVAMFLGLTNSVDDITRDRPVLLRERNLNVRLSYYVLAKGITLASFAVIQCILFTLVGNVLLSVRGVFWIVFCTMFLTTMSGVAIGLVISALVNESKTAVLAIPVVLIPQIILAGALIKYEDMNRDLDFVYSIKQWAERHPGTAMEPRSDLKVPFICQFMPMRWSYEALVFAQAKHNPLTRRQEAIQRQIDELAAIPEPTTEQQDRLEDLKDVLAVLSGLQAKTPAALDKKFAEIDAVIAGGPFDREKFRTRERGVTAEQLYVNQKVTDLISKAEMEQSDYRNDLAGKRQLNVFFGPVKTYFGFRIGLLWFNSGVLIVSTLALFAVLLILLNYQMRNQSA
jgi:hypothetical protein